MPDYMYTHSCTLVADTTHIRTQILSKRTADRLVGVSLLCSIIYLLCYAALLRKTTYYAQQMPLYYAQISLIKWLMYYNLDFAVAD